jgi:acetyl/propionyl-CoA carboxylase alpha subunit
MENAVRAHKTGVVTGLRVAVGDATTHDAILCTLI